MTMDPTHRIQGNLQIDRLHGMLDQNVVTTPIYQLSVKDVAITQFENKVA